MRLYQAAVAGAAAVAVIAGAIALAASATSNEADAFPDAFDASTSHTIRGPFLERYRGEDGPSGRLGLPVTDEAVTTYGPAKERGADREIGFRHGVIYLNSRTGETEVGLWYAWTPGTPSPSH